MLQNDQEQVQRMISRAVGALPFCYAPYSNFLVSAALLAESGRIYTGCNIENASYPAGLCAERTAFAKAVSEGEKKFRGIVILGGPNGDWQKEFCPPCGICRQVMREFADPAYFEIILAVSYEKYQIFTLEEMLPISFGPEQL